MVFDNIKENNNSHVSDALIYLNKHEERKKEREKWFKIGS